MEAESVDGSKRSYSGCEKSSLAMSPSLVPLSLLKTLGAENNSKKPASLNGARVLQPDAGRKG